MSKFVPTRIEATTGTEPQGLEGKIIKAEKDLGNKIEPFEFGKIKRQGEGDYSRIRQKFGALAATDVDRKAKSRKDERFQMNPLLKDRLAIEDEEKRAIEERVKKRLDELREKTLEEARAQGLAEGIEAGKKEALARYTAEAESKIARLEQLVAEAEGFRSQLYKANEHALLDLVFRISRMLFLKEISKDQEYVARLARTLVERVGTRENIRIRIHPDDSELLETVRAGIVQSFGNLQNLQVELSPQVRGGGAQLETRFNAIDASIGTQLESLFDALFGEGASSAGVTESNGAGEEGQPQ